MRGAEVLVVGHARDGAAAGGGDHGGVLSVEEAFAFGLFPAALPPIESPIALSANRHDAEPARRRLDEALRARRSDLQLGVHLGPRREAVALEKSFAARVEEVGSGGE